MAKANAAPVATPMDLIWNDGVVPAWLGGMTVAFIALFPILRRVFPKTCKQRGAFLLAFELVAAVPVRRDPRIRGARADRVSTHSTSSARRLEPRPRYRFSVDALGFAPHGNAIPELGSKTLAKTFLKREKSVLRLSRTFGRARRRRDNPRRATP